MIAGGRYSLTEITNITNISKGTLSDIKKWKTIKTKPRNDRPKKLTKHDKRHIEIYIHLNSQMRRSILLQLKKNLHLDATENIIRKALQELEYDHKVAQRYSFLKNRDRKARLQYAKRHRHWMIEDWKCVIFTNEMSVKIGMARHSRDMIWRKEDEKLHADYINYRKKPSGTGMMF